MSTAAVGTHICRLLSGSTTGPSVQMRFVAAPFFTPLHCQCVFGCGHRPAYASVGLPLLLPVSFGGVVLSLLLFVGTGLMTARRDAALFVGLEELSIIAIVYLHLVAQVVTSCHHAASLACP